MKTHSIVLSVIIPTYNRPERLRQCLQALAKQTYDCQYFEVIVVDDGSHTSMAPIIDELASKVDITLLQQQNSGPARARNKGAQQAKGQYLIFTDDDCTPTPDWLSQIAAHFVAHPHSFIGGHTLNALPDNPYSTASQLLIDYLYGYFNAEPGQASFFASNNFALPADLFHQMGGFDTTFPLAAGEDRELCDRIHQQGTPMRYVPDAQIWHAHELSLKKYWRQHFNYGRGAYHFHQVRSQRKVEPVQVEPLPFYIGLLTYPFRQSKGLTALYLISLMLVSQVANVAGFFWEKHQQNSRGLSRSGIR